MIKIVKSNRIYVKIPQELARQFELSYTFNIYSHPGQKYPKTLKQIVKVSDEVYQIERGALSHIEEVFSKKGIEYTILDRTVSTPSEFPALMGTPRQDQQDVVDELLAKGGNGIINGAPSYGKTFTAIYIASLLKEKTLVVCTTTAIRDNWITEIQKFLGITPGVIGSGSYNIDSPIVVGNIQSIVKYSQELSKEFGLIVIDEMHHTPATTFTNVLSSSNARYRIGLSGTLKRKDGLHVAFRGLFGNVIITPPERNRLKPVILRYPLEDVELSGNSMIPWANKITAVYDNNLYKETLLQALSFLVAADHTILFTSDRVALLEMIAEFFNGELFTGTVDTEERNMILQRVKSGDSKFIAGSQSIFSEGISCEPLSALLCSGSTNNESLVNQIIGRIQRLMVGKKQPIVIDIGLGGGLGKKHAKERKSIYLVNGWKVIECNTLTELADAVIKYSALVPEEV